MNATKYNVVFPLAKRDQYLANETVDFVVSLSGRKLVPNSLTLVGDAAIYSNVLASTSINIDQEVLIDADVGYHAMFRDFTTEFRDVGLTESFSYYPRYVKMHTQALEYQDSLGTETANCAEGKCLSEIVRRGYNLGGADPDGASRVPFALKPLIAPNKSDQPLAGDQFGAIRIRCRLAPNDEVVYGADATADSGYKLHNLQLRFETIPDDQSRPPVNMEVYHAARQVIETNNANLSSFVPGLASAVHMSFIPAADESNVNVNYLRCAPLVGSPLGGSDNNQSLPQNGADRLFYAVNDNDSALVGFTMESREEMVYNYLRSWNLEPKAYANVIRRMNRGDAYGLGIPFGTPLDFSQQKFAAEIDSLTQVPTAVYMYFKGAMQL
jgi:hypothetical protein